MTSQLLRKHRTTRWNTPQTVTAKRAFHRSGVRLTTSIRLATLAICMLPAAIQASEDGTTGRVVIGDTDTTLQQSRNLLRELRGEPRPPGPVIIAAAKSSHRGRIVNLPPTAPTGNTLTRQANVTPVASSVKKPGPPPVPPVPAVPEQAKAQPAVPPVPKLKSVPRSDSAAKEQKQVPAPGGYTDRIQMQINNILLTGSEEDGAGVIQLPIELPETDTPDSPSPPATTHDAVDLSGKVHLGTMTNHGIAVNRPRRPDRTTRVQKIFGFDGTVVKNNFRRGTTKVRHRAGKLAGPFVEFYDPDYDVDDYNMPILLIAAEDETDAPADEQEETGLLSRKLSDIKPTLDYAWGDLEDSQLPDDFHKRMDNGPYVEKTAPRTVVQWAPTNLWYYPLYFEDPALERYGHTRKPWIQPFVSTGRFFGQVVGLPYQATLHPPHCREYALGYYQPGEWAPKKKYQVPWNEEAAATEFLWITGLILLIP